MPLSAGTRLGAYDVLEPIGAGGMGEVYKARDARLERYVAIKILPSHVADDPILKQRFEREAKALAALSHPHICGVFDVGHTTTAQGDVDFLVMEYLEGETLARRLERGPLPLAEGLRHAMHLADALDQAHRKGVVHRDLKPGNIMLTPIGTKILDFGLARMTVGAGDAAAAVTVTSPLTGAGTLVGTFQYMAPEQLEGREADARSDVFAFGAVLFEMFTGQRAFAGNSQAGVIGAILERDTPPMSATQPSVPPALDQLVKTCLKKKPDERWQSAGDIGRQLSWILDDSAHSSAQRSAPPAVGTTKLFPVVPAVSAAVAIVAIVIAAWALTRSPAKPALEVSRLTLTPSSNAPVVSVGGVDVLITPDGRSIIYLGPRPDGGGRMLYQRDLKALESRPIAGTELPGDFGVANPFITADGQSVVFRSPGKGILSVPLRGGPAIKVADDSPRYLSGTSAAGNTVVLALGDGLYRTSAAGGGTLERITQPKPQTIFVGPSALPGGNVVLFHMRDVRERVDRVYLVDLRTREERALADDGVAPQYASSGHIVFARGTTLMAVPFDAGRLAVTGAAVAVQEGVQHPSAVQAPDFSISTNGTLIYTLAEAATSAPATLTWVDRSGRETAPAVTTPMTNLSGAQLSPDGKRLVASFGAPLDQDLWVFDLTGRPPLRLADKGANLFPTWSPDGTRVVFVSDRNGPYGIFSMPADGSALEPSPVDLGVAQRVSGVPTMFPLTWMPDGRLVFANNASVAANSDILVAPSEPGGKAQPLVQTEYSEGGARVSPDGRWLAYQSDRSGRPEIWVQPIATGAPVRVSSNGGIVPVWSRDNRELFYREGAKMMAVKITGGSAFAFDPAVPLFDRRSLMGFDVSSDGRFLMALPSAPSAAPPAPNGIVVVQNWTEELKRLVPVR